MKIEVNDIIETKKFHPCGNNKWKVLRIGMDFKIKCLKCNCVLMLSRKKIIKITKKVVNDNTL